MKVSFEFVRKDGLDPFKSARISPKLPFFVPNFRPGNLGERQKWHT
jgi:hypothetical protein